MKWRCDCEEDEWCNICMTPPWKDRRNLPCHDCGHDYRLHKTGLAETLGSCNVPDCSCYEYKRHPVERNLQK